MPPPGYITIPRSEYETILYALRVAAYSAQAEGALHRRIGALAPRITPPRIDLALALEASETLARAITRIERRLREYDLEMTPIHPPSHEDIEAAFASSEEFAQRKKKPGPGSSGG